MVPICGINILDHNQANTQKFKNSLSYSLLFVCTSIQNLFPFLGCQLIRLWATQLGHDDHSTTCEWEEIDKKRTLFSLAC